MNQQDNFDVNEWIRYAQMDYDTAKNIAEIHRPVPIEIVCYLCQQSAEKILKAYIISTDNFFKKTHDLLLLLKECSSHNPRFDNFRENCFTLSSYAALARYPSSDRISQQDMEQALLDSQNILEFAKSRLLEMGYNPVNEI